MENKLLITLGIAAFSVAVVYYFKVIIPDKKRCEEELNKELEQVGKKCNNCKFMNRFKLTYDPWECYCSDGSIHNAEITFVSPKTIIGVAKFNDFESVEFEIKFN